MCFSINILLSPCIHSKGQWDIFDLLVLLSSDVNHRSILKITHWLKTLGFYKVLPLHLFRELPVFILLFISQNLFCLVIPQSSSLDTSFSLKKNVFVPRHVGIEWEGKEKARWTPDFLENNLDVVDRELADLVVSPGTLTWATHSISLSPISVISKMGPTLVLFISQVAEKTKRDSGSKSPFLIFKNILPLCMHYLHQSQEQDIDWKVLAHYSGHLNFHPSCAMLVMYLGTLCYTDFTSKIQFRFFKVQLWEI